MRHGRPRAARAELDNLARGSVPQPLGERLGEAAPVRVVAPGPAVCVEHHGVDRAERLGVLGESVEVGDDRLLARIRDVEPVVTEPPCSADELPYVVRAET